MVMAMNCTRIYEGYAIVNSFVFSLAVKVPRVGLLAVLVFTVIWFQMVFCAATEAREETGVSRRMVGVEDKL